ncbi:MAG: OmpA family protein [Acidimicrobiia bacterium]|nr:OmpA family protein [Acidimicrobiia bacterium]
MGDFDEDFGVDEDAVLAERGILLHPLTLAALGVALLTLGFLAFLASDDSEQSVEAPAADSATTLGTEDVGAASEPEPTDGESAIDTTPPETAYVEATLDLDVEPGQGLFRLSGRVPDSEVEAALLQAAEAAYAPYVQSEIEVDESLEPAPFLAPSPQLIGLLPSITDGTIRITEAEVTLTGRSPDQARVDLLTGALEQLGGRPVQVENMEITGLGPNRFQAAVEDGRLTIGGEVGSETVRRLLIDGATAAYGEENVTDELTVSPSAATTFWMYTIPRILGLLAPFPRYEISVMEGVISGRLQGGVNFPVNETEITSQISPLLDIAVSIMTRDVSLLMSVEGHTDSTGPEQGNQALSLARAESVVDYFAEAGIDRARLTALGAGETQPIATNATAEGRALNRRVEFQLEANGAQ